MDDSQTTLSLAGRIVAERLECLQRAGVQQIGRVRPALAPTVPAMATAVAQPTATAVDAVSPLPALPPAPPAEVPVMARAKPAVAAAATSMLSLLSQPYPADIRVAAAERQKLLDGLNTEVRGCQLCRELACSRKQTVFGVGNARPRVVFFGEAPGADEDRQGEPFVGRAGQLLTKIIEACGWQRSDVYIMNVLKCRPPDNRNPLPAETDNCRPFFERQFEILRPEYIVCVGTVPGQALLETTESVGKLRGRFYGYRGSKVLVTYHPSYLLRNPAAKKYVWDDMQLLLKEMGLPIPKRGGG